MRKVLKYAKIITPERIWKQGYAFIRLNYALRRKKLPFKNLTKKQKDRIRHVFRLNADASQVYYLIDRRAKTMLQKSSFIFASKNPAYFMESDVRIYSEVQAAIRIANIKMKTSTFSEHVRKQLVLRELPPLDIPAIPTELMPSPNLDTEQEKRQERHDQFMGGKGDEVWD